MKRSRALILLSLSISVLAACGVSDPSTATAVRVSYEERILGPQYQATMAAVLVGQPAADKQERTARTKQAVEVERVRLVEVARLQEEARLAEVARLEAEAAAEAERVRLEEEAEARRAAAAAKAKAQAKATPTTVAASRAPTSGPSVPSTGSGACGGDLPPCSVMQKESGGSPTAVSPYGYCDGGDKRCHGKWQFDLDTWASLGYTGLPEEHSEAVQDEAARKLLARSGCGQWSTC
jgi:hypothetical protein